MQISFGLVVVDIFMAPHHSSDTFLIPTLLSPSNSTPSPSLQALTHHHPTPPHPPTHTKMSTSTSQPTQISDAQVRELGQRAIDAKDSAYCMYLFFSCFSSLWGFVLGERRRSLRVRGRGRGKGGAGGVLMLRLLSRSSLYLTCFSFLSLLFSSYPPHAIPPRSPSAPPRLPSPSPSPTPVLGPPTNLPPPFLSL